VAASEPYKSQRSRTTRSLVPSVCKRLTKWAAARMGPTVWEEDGPIPMVKRSSAERVMVPGRRLCGEVDGGKTGPRLAKVPPPERGDRSFARRPPPAPTQCLGGEVRFELLEELLLCFQRADEEQASAVGQDGVGLRIHDPFSSGLDRDDGASGLAANRAVCEPAALHQIGHG